MRHWARAREIDIVRMIKTMLVIASCMSAMAVLTAAQDIGGNALTDLSKWTPTAVISVCSVIFAFGISWQTIRVHGKVLKQFEEWRADFVDPRINKHETQIGILEAESALMRHRERERHGPPTSIR